MQRVNVRMLRHLRRKEVVDLRLGLRDRVLLARTLEHAWPRMGLLEPTPDRGLAWRAGVAIAFDVDREPTVVPRGDADHAPRLGAGRLQGSFTAIVSLAAYPAAVRWPARHPGPMAPARSSKPMIRPHPAMSRPSCSDNSPDLRDVARRHGSKAAPINASTASAFRCSDGVAPILHSSAGDRL